MNPSTLRRTLLRLFVGCLGVTALLAILAVLAGDFGDFTLRVLGTSASVSAASICAMACAAFHERGRVPRIGMAGIALAAVTLLQVLVMIWTDHPGQALLKTGLVFVVWTVAVAHAELLLLPRLAVRHAWTQGVAVTAIGLLAILLTVVILGEVGSDAFGRLTAVVAILVALLTLVVPILRTLRGDTSAASTPTPEGVASPDELVLRRAADGSWTDPSGVRYALHRCDEAPGQDHAP